MNIFMRKEVFLIKKIKKTEKGWLLHPFEKEEETVFIGRENYSGKMPPFFKWPWQKVRLEIVKIEDFIVSANLGGKRLFEIPENEYPSEIKKILEKGERLEAKVKKAMEDEDNAIKEALSEYLLKIPINPDLEDNVSKFQICLRAYLKLHLFKGEVTEDYLRRLNLMTLILDIVQRIYRRHVDEKSFFGVVFAQLKYSVPMVFPDYRMDAKDIENAVKDKSVTDKTLADYYEAERLITQTLPKTDNALLLRYLNYVVRDVLSVFAGDYANFDCSQNKRAGKRIFSDEDDYKCHYRRMQMLKYKSFILPKEFSEEEIENFIHNYSLK